MSTGWTVHFMNARGALDPFVDPLRRALDEVARRVAPLVPPIALDVQVEAAATQGIPEYGHSGYAPRPGLVRLTLYPENPNLADSLGEPLERMIAHELHHALRWDAVGYGTTLLGALASEGLAGRFVHELYANAHEPWERPPAPDALRSWAAEAARGAGDARYDHDRWFFGAAELPKHAGYKLGYAMVEAHERLVGTVPSAMVATPAESFETALASLATEY